MTSKLKLMTFLLPFLKTAIRDNFNIMSIKMCVVYNSSYVFPQLFVYINFAAVFLSGE